METYQQLERDWADWNDLDPAGMVVCASGTAALHLALEALQLPAGSEVLMPDFTMIACARAVTLAGLTPVFVDCDERLSLNPYLLSDARTEREVLRNVSAVMAVHVYGRSCDMEEITYYAGEHRWSAVIEDLAEAHGIRPHEGTDAACWSFFRNKIVAGEEGGAVWFRNPRQAALARQLRSLGFTEAHDFRHLPRGHNYRLSNAHAELILQSLAQVESNQHQRRIIEGWYDAACPAAWRMPPREAVWVYDLRIPGLGEERQDRLIHALRSAGIAARHAFKPMHEQEEYRDCRRITAGESCAARLAREVIYLPVDPQRTTSKGIAYAFDLMREE